MPTVIKILSLTCLLAALTQVSKAQNLVPNPSFETYSQCPDPATVDPMPDNMIDLATGWNNPTGYTPDYFNACVEDTFNSNNVPYTWAGFQHARTGNGYAGIISMIETEGREYIQTELTESLIAGKQYSVTFYVSLCEISTYAANNIGAYFSDTPVSVSHSWVLPYTPQISNNPFTNQLTDTLGWTEVSGVFTALGGEQYMIIGNFNDDASTDTTHKPVLPSPWWEASYHYIDDVSVVCLDCTVGISDTSIKSRISIFPNPATDYLNINFTDIYPERITMFNGMGETLAQKQVSGNLIQINVSDYPAGIYYLNIVTKDFSVTKRVLINH